MLSALIMAGGRGERMARSGAPRPKPLVEVVGVPVIERNLQQLVRAGVDRVTVSVASDADEVRAFVRDRLVPLGKACGIVVGELVEQTPLGNIGAAGLLADEVDELLVVYADNVTTLDLAALVDEHRAHRPELTLAAHREPFRMPFGELRVDDRDRLVSYTEKPTYRILVGSAVMVMGRGALGSLATDRPTGISELSQRLVDDGRPVHVSVHDAPWIDVNDLASAAAADGLVADHLDEFETWLPEPVERWTLDLAVAASFERTGSRPSAAEVLEASSSWRRGARDGVGDDPGGVIALGTFDAADTATGRRLRADVRIGRSTTDRSDADAPSVDLLAARIAALLALGASPDARAEASR